MPPLRRVRLAPGVPRAVLAAVVTAAALLVVLTAAPPGPHAPAGSPSVPVLLAGLVLHGGLLWLFLWRARRLGQERAVWTRIALSAAIFGLAAATGLVLTLVPATREHAMLPLAWAPALAFPPVYRGVVRWNRSPTPLADPNDMLNGFSAVMAGLAVLNVVVERVDGDLAAAPWWQTQALLAQASTGLVVAGSALTVACVGAMSRDPRVWLVGAAFALSFAGDAQAVLLDGRTAMWAVICEPLGGVLLGVAAVLRPARIAPQPADPTSTTIGAFLVIVSSTVVLLLGHGSTGSGLPTWFAAIAALASSARLLVNVRELAQLAVSRREALTDELTGLANRRAVLRRLEELVGERIPVAFALLDLDKFKEVNDGLGHAVGDGLLRQVADRLQPGLRPGDLLGRLGGDEFAVVAVVEPDVPPEAAAEALCRRLHARLTEPFRVGGMSVHVGASIGGTWSAAGSPPADNPIRLLREADLAMYDAKRSGAGSVLYDGTRHAGSGRRLALVEDLRTALAENQLVLYHQPQVAVATGEVLGVEALVRWAHPRHGLLGPGDFLPTAEAHGLMGALTDRVLAGAVAQLAAWRRSDLRLHMSVNLSSSDLLDTGLPRCVAALLAEHGVPAEDLTLEVTESVLLTDWARGRTTLTALRELGVGLSIDDFGTGYSSLAYLRELPATQLKLDRSFTADLVSDARTEAIVASTIELAHRLGLRVVAEGVEDECTLARLTALGCDESQGYLHSPPLPARELKAWVGPPERAPELTAGPRP